MCGRAYSTYSEEELRLRYLNKQKIKIPKFKPNYNMSPTHEVLVHLIKDAKPQLSLFRWGLIPFWAKDIKIGYKMINARSETLAEKPSFRNAFKSRRCIVPLSGFIEWRRTDEAKRPFCISLQKEPIMSVAGIWETWKPEGPEGKEELHTFSVITTEANKFMEKIHDRMPVILDAKDEAEWLDPDNTDTAKLSKLFKPCPSRRLQAYEVGVAINSPKNNSKEVIQPLTGEVLEG